MRRSEALEGVRVIKFRDVLGRYEAAEFSQLEAAELLGIGERTFRRWRVRFEDDGEAGLLDRRLGKASGRRVPVNREQEVEVAHGIGGAHQRGQAAPWARPMPVQGRQRHAALGRARRDRRQSRNPRQRPREDARPLTRLRAIREDGLTVSRNHSRARQAQLGGLGFLPPAEPPTKKASFAPESS
jgi:hypothetical protein